MHLRRTRRTRLAVTAALTGAVLALSACSGGSSSEGQGPAGGSEPTTITVFNGSTGTIAENWNPHSPTLLRPARGILYEPLFYYNITAPAGTEPEPILGTDWSWNEDGTELTITTREGVTWSDGEPFTAADVAFSLNLPNEHPELNASGFDGTAEATSDNTVVVRFPETSFVQEASVLGDNPILPEHVWSELDPVTTINPDPVVTGPYTVAEFSPQSYVLAANPNYWGGAPAVDRVRYIALAGADAASAALLAGDVDWMSSFFPGLQQLMASNPELSWVNSPAFSTTFHTCANADLGCTGPQTDVAVRQAIYHGIDRTQLNQLAFADLGAMPSPALLMPERDADWIADDIELAPANADVARARSILEGAGWTMGGDGIYTRDGQRLTLNVQVVSGYSDFISAIEAMTQQLREVGIELTSSQLSYNEWAANETNGTFQLSMDSIGPGPSTDPYFVYARKYATSTTAPVGQSASSNNQVRYSNPVVDQEAIEAAAQMDDDAVKAEQYAIIQREIARDMSYIPIIIGSTLTEFNNSRVTGWPTQDDLYAFPASWKSWDNGIVLKNLQPAGQ
ncbi:ABC transporter substrate-binding protein [Pseudonocardia nigra]|uniref:ABC transporter substrate-binding protein n=1 Tax=Pseudonocardia nigra TaxID=1921578 RepID=UPI001C603AE1|nr:ABC transporter substrate-binding protein [Pseudonocardia nigra]